MPRVASTAFMRRVASSGLASNPALVRQPKQFGQMQRRARALLPADHGEMILMAVEIGHEHDAGLVEPRRRLEDMARQRHRRPQHVVEAGLVSGGEPRQRVGRRRRDGIEDAEQRMGETLLVAGDQFGIIEIVAGIHLHVPVEPAAHVDLALLVEQRDLHAVDLRRIGVDDADRNVHRRIEIGRAPVIRQRRIEHVAEPVDDHGLAHLRQHAVIDLDVVVGTAADFRQRTRRHQDDPAAGLLDRRDLFLIGADHVVDGLCVLRRQMIGAGAGKHQRAAPRLRRPHRALDQFQRGRPVQPHAALRGIHRFGDAEAEIPDMFAKGDGLVPVDRGRQPRIDIGQRIGHHMRRRECHAVQRALKLWRETSATPRGDRSRSNDPPSAISATTTRSA